MVGGCGEGLGEDATGVSAPATMISLELVHRVGCSDCGGAEQLTPTVMAMFEDGRLAVLDRYEPFVRMFTPDGEPERTFGAPGQGPGELGGEVGGMYFVGVYLMPWPDGSVSVLELLPATVETFAAEGSFLRQETLELPMSAPGAQAFAARTGTYFRHSYVPASDLPDVIGRCSIDPAGGSECRELTTVTALTGADPQRVRSNLSLAATPQGDLIVADADTYRLWLLDADGDTLQQFGRDIPLPPKSDAELEAERAANRQRREAGRGEREIDPSRRHISPSGVQVDGAGRVWVLTQRYTADHSVFDVLDSGGDFLGEITVETPIVSNPNQVTPFVIAGDRLAAMATLSDGSTRIDVYRIVER